MSDYVDSVPLRNQLDAMRQRAEYAEAKVQAKAVQIHSMWTDMRECWLKLERIREIAANPDPYDRDGEADALRKILDVIE